MYQKYVVLMGNLYLKGLDSKNSKNRQTKTSLSITKTFTTFRKLYENS